MKPRLFLPLALGSLLCAAPLNAQTFGPQIAPGAPSSAAPQVTPSIVGAPAVRLTSEQLDQLLGPIALYPDALIALILPSATASSDVVLAARYLAGDGNAPAPAQIEDQAWDDSVKALAHYPSLVKWMDQNLAWTKQVGETFIEQPAEVMKSIQRLRAAARAAGTLVDTPEQQIVAEAETISIVPAQADVIYVPYYDPQIVYVRRPNYSYYPGNSFFSFSVGYPVGFWLGYNMDWRHRRIWITDRHQREHYWHDQADWRRPSFPSGEGRSTDSIRRPWTPNPVYARTPSQPVVRRAGIVVVRPSPIALESTVRSPNSYWNSPDRVDRTPGNRESTRSQDSSSRVQPGSRSRTQNFQPTDSLSSPQVQTAAPLPNSPPAVSSPSAAPTQPTVYTRGNRSPQGNQSDAPRSPERESRSRPAPSARAESSPAVRSAPASTPMVVAAPAQSPAPSPASSPSVSRTEAAPAASASSPSTTDTNSQPAQRSYSRGR